MRALIYLSLGLIWKLQASTVTTRTCTMEENVQYYIYSLNVNLEVHYCVNKSKDFNDCEELGLSSDTGSEQQDMQKCYQKLNDYNITNKDFVQILPCRSNEKVKFIPSKMCPYHQGYCQFKHREPPHPWTFIYWTTSEQCSVLESIFHSKFEIWRAENNLTKFISVNTSKLDFAFGVIALQLLDNYTVCGVDTWMTNINGILASNKPIETAVLNGEQLWQYGGQFQTVYNTIKSDCQVDRENENQNDENSPKSEMMSISLDEEITKMENRLYYLTVVIIIFILCISIIWIFNIYVNFLTLKRAGKKTEIKDKPHFFNSLSQSLTNRYLFLNKTSYVKSDKLEKPLEASQNTTVDNQYEYVDIESLSKTT